MVFLQEERAVLLLQAAVGAWGAVSEDGSTPVLPGPTTNSTPTSSRHPGQSALNLPTAQPMVSHCISLVDHRPGLHLNMLSGRRSYLLDMDTAPGLNSKVYKGSHGYHFAPPASESLK